MSVPYHLLYPIPISIHHLFLARGTDYPAHRVRPGDTCLSRIHVSSVRRKGTVDTFPLHYRCLWEYRVCTGRRLQGDVVSSRQELRGQSSRPTGLAFFVWSFTLPSLQSRANYL